MNAEVIALIVFACVYGGALLGMLIRSWLPEHHVSGDARDVMKLGIGLIATTTALVLGLLTASAKSAFDTENAEIRSSGANLVLLDRTLAQYGPEAAPIRALLKQAVGKRIELTWPASGAEPVRMDSADLQRGGEVIEQSIRTLQPSSDVQRALQVKALAVTSDLLKSRWLVMGQAAGSAIPLPFLIVVVFWLSVIFACFGLLAPANRTLAAVLGLSALSVAAAVFLILEMDHPFGGLIRVSGEPLRYALSQIGG
ncbi:hypothetical protein K2Z84_23240 [Candidatus Binatia bacterium]|nr:hypothetical protein [Candidatus Binatia bacterium]